MFEKIKNLFGAANRQGSRAEPEADAEEHLKRGNAHLDRGLLADAADCYRRAVTLRPDYGIAYVNLAHTLNELDRLDEAEKVIKQAMSLVFDNPDLHYIYGSVLGKKNDAPGAMESLRKAIELKPAFAEAVRDLALMLFKDGQSDLAKEFIHRGLLACTGNPDLHYYLGNIHSSTGDHETAMSCYQDALAIQPDYVEVLNNLGMTYQQMGKAAEAEACYRKAISLQPKYAPAHVSLGILLGAQGQWHAAIECYDTALELDPQDATAHCELGVALKIIGQLDDAIDSFSSALAIAPDDIKALCNMGVTFQSQGKTSAATKCFQDALLAHPDSAVAHNNLASALWEKSELAQAAEHLLSAVALRPDYADAYANLGAIYSQQSQYSKALDSIEKSLQINPENFENITRLLFIKSEIPEVSRAEYYTDATRYGQLALAKAKPYTSWLKRENSSAHSLRIGFVSGDLRHHPVGFFLESLLQFIDSQKFSFFAYSTKDRDDDLTARIKPHFNSWKLIEFMSDEQAAQVIHEDGIDILVDLSGHTAFNRLALFAWRPAPVQATWLGYWASTGVPGIDWLIADPVSVPENHEERFSESIWRLPHIRYCFSPPATEEDFPLTPLPAQVNGYITIASFQSLNKLNDEVLQLWGRVFRSLPDARLKIQSRQMACEKTRESLLVRLEQNGITRERVSLHGHTPRKEYFAVLAGIDMILDTFPYPGGTTTCEALWMGVPTLTLAGNSLLSRQGNSILTCVGLPQWIASNEEDFVNKALHYANDIHTLADLRANLRQQSLVSPLFDAKLFARDFQNALEGMWQAYSKRSNAPFDSVR